MCIFVNKKVKIVFILCDTFREENVGAVARAVKTMGMHALYLVRPLCDHLGKRARATAHGSADILEKARLFDSLEEVRDETPLLIGSAAKKRNVREDRHPVEQLPGILRDKTGLVEKAGIVFGGEESGLANRDLDLCDLLTTIPMHRPYPSLNLAQAVMVYAAHLSQLTLDLAEKKQPNPTDNELRIVREKALQVLEDVGIPPDHIIHRRIMERLMLMGHDDMHLFHSFCKFYLKKYHGRVK